LNTAYRQEQRLSDIVRYASFLAIFIACMGLFGLATLVVVRRTREIGIRKVLVPMLAVLWCCYHVILWYWSSLHRLLPFRWPGGA
jgi:Na+/alanine symporter